MLNMILGVLALAAMSIIGYLVSWKKGSLLTTVVRDGDSIRIDGARVTIECRITGYDAPEWSQPHGAEATKALKALLENGYRWKVAGIDSYGRVLIHVRNAKGSIGRQMVLSGNAHNSSNLGFYEFIAKILRRGLWGKPYAIHPATYRAIVPKSAR